MSGSARRSVRVRSIWVLVACTPLLGATCSGLDVLFGPFLNNGGSGSELTLAVAIVQPASAVNAVPGVTTVIQWADIVSTAGTVARVVAQRQDSVGENLGDPIHLIGDGTPGSGRDALADGDNDVYLWDITGVRVGDYVITVTLESPDGTTATAVSRDPDRGTTGLIRVTTALPKPTLTFTAPGAADETVNGGDTFNITWTDNGIANAEALLTLGLDLDGNHDSGNEVILLQDAALSIDDDAGTFTFSGVDENGGAIDGGTYRVFARLDDGVNLIVTKEATGRLIWVP